jgi:hypothetical protein
MQAQQGGVLAIMLFALIPVIALVGTLSSRQLHEANSYQARLNEQRSTDQALSGLELARSLVMNSSYQVGRNDVLLNASLQSGTSSLRPHPTEPGQYLALNIDTGEYVSIATASGLPANLKAFRSLATLDLVDMESGERDDKNEKVSLYAVPVVGLWHILECDAEIDGIRRTARTYARERDPFSRYAMFTNLKWLNLGSVPDGAVHANRGITFHRPNKNYPAYVITHEGFYYSAGADPSNIIFSGGSSPYAETIQMPSVNDVSALGNVASGAFNVSSSYDQVRITFNRKRVTIVARKRSNNSTVTLVNNQLLPSNGVIYAALEITAISGDIEGRVTVATPSTVEISGNLRYVDGNNQSAYINNNNAANYGPNPQYNGTSTLGIIGGGDVVYGTSLPQNTEINAAIFSGGNIRLSGMGYNSSGDWTGSYNSSFVRDNLCILGAMIMNYSGVNQIYNSSTGAVLSGFEERAIRYDWDLLNNPPPHFLSIDRPMFRGIEIVQDRAGSEVAP